MTPTATPAAVTGSWLGTPNATLAPVGHEWKCSLVGTSWKDESKVSEYLERLDRLSARRAGEAELLEALPSSVARVLDLGCGDGRVIEVIRSAHPEVAAVGLDNSAPMLDRARSRFDGDPSIEFVEHDLAENLPPLGAFDVVVSGFAIHHLTHDRKRSLFREVSELLPPGGVFANLEVVQCATPELHEEFNNRIGRPGGDPEDILAGVDEQLAWMRAAGLHHVDCQWRWRGFALLVGARTHGQPAGPERSEDV